MHRCWNGGNHATEWKRLRIETTTDRRRLRGVSSTSDRPHQPRISRRVTAKWFITWTSHMHQVINAKSSKEIWIEGRDWSGNWRHDSWGFPSILPCNNFEENSRKASLCLLLSISRGILITPKKLRCHVYKFLFSIYIDIISVSRRFSCFPAGIFPKLLPFKAFPKLNIKHFCHHSSTKSLKTSSKTVS